MDVQIETWRFFLIPHRYRNRRFKLWNPICTDLSLQSIRYITALYASSRRGTTLYVPYPMDRF